MASRSVEAEIDRLYQLAPEEFTAARNALAKTAGADAPEVRRLAKPPLAAWAVNQLYWKRRGLYDALIGASQELRQVHKAILAGRPPSREAEAGRGDLRGAGKSHEEAIESASKAALAILQEGRHPATDATRQAIVTTLRALPAEEPPGRLTRALQPGGFEMLAGLSLGGGLKRNLRQMAEATKKADPTKRAEVTQEKAARTTAKAETPAEKRVREQALSRAREAAAKAEREQRAAEHAAQREEFEAARSAREAEKAVKQLEQAREALAAAQSEFETAKASAAIAARARDAAARRSKEAQRALESARTRSQAALKAIP
jgi:hypothetical protein